MCLASHRSNPVGPSITTSPTSPKNSSISASAHIGTRSTPGYRDFCDTSSEGKQISNSTTQHQQHRDTELKEPMTQTTTAQPRLTDTAQTALTTILNLRTLTKETGTITTRAQNDVLRALNSADIASVANALAAL
jgi:hypothetical protein